MKKKHQQTDYRLVRLNRNDMSERTRIIMRDIEDENLTRSESMYVFAEKNPLVVSVISAFFLPYMLGMLLMLVLFYFYVGISITDFFHVYSGLSQVVFWVFGAYLIITVTDLWLLFKKLTLKSK